MNRVLPCEIAQVIKGSNDTQLYGVGSGDIGKELPRNKLVVCVLLLGERFRDTTGNVSRIHVCSGDILRSTIVVRGALHKVSQKYNSLIQTLGYSCERAIISDTTLPEQTTAANARVLGDRAPRKKNTCYGRKEGYARVSQCTKAQIVRGRRSYVRLLKTYCSGITWLHNHFGVIV